MEAMMRKYLVNIVGCAGSVGTIVYALSVEHLLPVVGALA